MENLIRHYRQNRGMTQTQLAEQLGTTTQSVSRLETGNMRLSIDWLERIGTALGVHATALLPAPQDQTTPLMFAQHDGTLGNQSPGQFMWPQLDTRHLAIRMVQACGPFLAGETLVCQALNAEQLPNALGQIVLVTSPDWPSPRLGRLLHVNTDPTSTEQARGDLQIFSGPNAILRSVEIHQLHLITHSVRALA